MLSLKLALKELTHNYAFSILFIISMSIGLLGLTALDSLRISIRESLNRRSKGFLSADIGVGARRPLKPEEQNLIERTLPKNTEYQHLRESLTMVAGVARKASEPDTVNLSRLTELRVIEPAYPFFGEIELTNQGLITSTSKKDLFSGPYVWVYPELLLQLDINIRDRVKIGSETFEVSDTILRDSAGAGSDVSFAPPVYISAESFAKTGLNGPGSLGYHTLLARLPNNASGEITENFAKTLHKELKDPGVQVNTPKDSSEQIGRVLTYLGDYLNLAGLVALLLSSIGQFYLLRNYFARRTADMSVYKSLGLAAHSIFLIYFLQILMLTALAALATLGLTAWALPHFTQTLHNLLNIDLFLYVPLNTILLVVSVAILQSSTLTLPYFDLIRRAQVRDLLQASAPAMTDDERRTSDLQWLWFLPAGLSFTALSLALSHSLKIGAIFIGALIAATLLLIFLATYVLRTLSRFHWRPRQSLALKHMVRSRATTLSAFLALSLGVLLSNLIPQIEAGIRDEISTPPGAEQPSLFLFDIQDEQLSPLLQALSDLRLAPMQTAPMVRARLSTMNGAPFAKPEREENWSREKESENRSRNRGYNLSYRNELSKSESLSEGQPFVTGSNTAAQISIEKRFADRLGVKIGDRLSFDVQGVEIEGRIVNLRKVRWTSFQPNFFIQFNEGPLDNAPKTHLVTLPQMPLERKTLVQRKIVKQFPNVAILDVSRIIERMLLIIGQLALALKVMALLTMLVGLLILFFVTHNQVNERKKEANLFKVLGAPEHFIESVFISEVFLLVVMALTAGTALSYGIGYLLSYFIFDSLFKPDYLSPAYLAVTVITASLIVTFWILRLVLRDQPRNILQSN